MTASEKPLPSPRPLSRPLRYRALAAKPVSMLLLTCAIIFIGCVYTARTPFGEWLRIRRLKKIGRSATAIVTEISKRLPRKERGAPSEYVTFEFRPAPDAQTIIGERLRSLFMHLDNPPQIHSKLDLLYDPANPSDFFCPESDDRSLASHLSVQIAFLLIAGVVLLIAALRYRVLLNVICSAPAQLGTLVQVRTSAQGAFSRLVVVAFEFDSRSFALKTVVPARLAQFLSIGDSVWILVPPRKPNRAIIAAAFLD